MLLAGLQGERVSGFPVRVHGFAHDPSRQLPHVDQMGCDDPEIGPPVAQMIAEGLPLPHGDVCPELARGCENPQREGFEHLDRFRAADVRRFEDLPDGHEFPVEVGMLYHHRRHVLPHRWHALEGLGCVARPSPQRLQQRHVPSVQAARHKHAPPVRPEGHVNGLRQRGGAVIERGVRHSHAGQLAHHRLVLEEHLQNALGQLGLVGRVGRVELRAGGERPYDRGHVVVVRARPSETHEVVHVAVPRRESSKVRHELHLGDALAHREPPIEPDGHRDLIEETIQGPHADRREHVVDLVLCMRSERHEPKCTDGSCGRGLFNPTRLRGRTC